VTSSRIEPFPNCEALPLSAGLFRGGGESASLERAKVVGLKAAADTIEWLMGLELLGSPIRLMELTSNQQITSLGNGVMPLQAAQALRSQLHR